MLYTRLYKRVYDFLSDCASNKNIEIISLNTLDYHSQSITPINTLFYPRNAGKFCRNFFYSSGSEIKFLYSNKNKNQFGETIAKLLASTSRN